MSFAGELKDFLTSYKTMSDVNEKRELNAIRWQESDTRKRATDSVIAERDEPNRVTAEARDRFQSTGRTAIPAVSGYDPEAARRAVGDIESSGRYDALGPRTRKGDRAYGRYQVMGANIPQWTKEILGRSYTPDEFLRDQAAQDKVFQGKFGQYVKQYGNVGDAASAWFTGGPQTRRSANSRDVLGTSGSSYVNKFLSAYSRYTGGAAPTPSAPEAPGAAQRATVAPAMTNRGAIPGELASAPLTEETDDYPDITQGFAEGGMVADDTFSEGGQSAGQYFSAEQQRGGATPGPNLGEALDGGIQYIMSNFGMRQGGVPNPQAGAALARGEGAFTPQEMQQVRATVDPENKMDDALANIYALDALYQHYLKKGDPRKAQAAAASLMMYTMRHAAARGAQAQQEQDPNKRAQLIADGYNAIPNGKKVEPSVGPNGTGQFTVKDARTGQVVQQGQYSPEQLAAAALGLRDGSVYWQSIMQAAGVRGEKPPTAQQQRQQNLQEFQQTGALDLQPEGQTAPIDGDNPPPNAGDEMDGQGAQLPKSAPPRMYRDALDEEQKQKFDALPNTDKNRLQREWSTRIKTQETAAKQKIEDERKARGEATRPMPVGDRTKSEEATNTAVDEVLPEEPAKGQKAVEPAARSTIKSGAYAIFTHAGNGNISATEAARAAAAIAGQTPGDPPQVKVEGDQALVRLKNGRVIRIPTSALTDLAAYQKKSKTVASDEGPSGLRRLGESSIPFGVGAGINVARGAIGAATNPKVQETLKKFYNTPSPPRVSNYPNEREVRARGGILNPEAKRRALGVD